MEKRDSKDWRVPLKNTSVAKSKKPKTWDLNMINAENYLGVPKIQPKKPNVDPELMKAMAMDRKKKLVATAATNILG